jgi:hypothetical protein
MTPEVVLVWIAGVLLMAALTELWYRWERNDRHGFLRVCLSFGAVCAFFTPLVLALIPGAVLWGLVRFISPVLFRRVVKPFVKSALILAGRKASDPVVEHLVAEHQRLQAEQQAIERAIETNPGDPALLGRIERLTAEAESTDRAALQRINRQAALAFGTPPEQETPPLWRRLGRRENLLKLPRLVGVGVILLAITGLVYVAVALTRGQHHPSRNASAETVFRKPGLSGYGSAEIISMVEHKVSEEGVFNAAQESIACPEGRYTAGAVLTCTLDSPQGKGDFDVEVTKDGIRIEMPHEAR